MAHSHQQPNLHTSSNAQRPWFKTHTSIRGQPHKLSFLHTLLRSITNLPHRPPSTYPLAPRTQAARKHKVLQAARSSPFLRPCSCRLGRQQAAGSVLFAQHQFSAARMSPVCICTLSGGRGRVHSKTRV